jgi:MoxR-like ATPase
MPNRSERGDGHHGVGDSERAPHWQSVVSAVLEHNGHRRPGPPDVAVASYRLPTEGAERSELTVTEVGELGDRLRTSVRAGVRLPDSVLEVVLAVLLAGGHLLVEDHPGVGKTQLARTLARGLGGSFARVQATVDLLPADIVGASIWRPDSASFQFRPGPVFANVVLVDELNRATPKAQSGLLEAMQEGQVTVDGSSWPLPRPFVVLATQNPAAGQVGTYRLPPAQLDRFLARVSLGYPTAAQEMALLRGAPQPPATPAPVCSPAELLAAQQTTARVHAAEVLLGYLVGVLAATRAHPLAEVGASPRAGLGLMAAARARAALQGREFVVPDDVKALAQPVLAHRIQPLATTTAETPAQVVADAIAQVPAR